MHKIKAAKHWGKGTNWNFIQTRLFSKANCQKIEDFLTSDAIFITKAETSTSVDRKNARAPKAMTVDKERHLITWEQMTEGKLLQSWQLNLILLNSNQGFSQLWKIDLDQWVYSYQKISVTEGVYVVHTISFQTFLVQAFIIVIDSWKFTMLLLYIL